uniref:Capsid protein n=1 Tax=Chicken virus mg5_2876 TaxID=2720907 RepID=A0A9E9BXA8_9VIRU|nr:MAG: capsid protein [Chicken virus mg5_2876]
MAYKKRRYNTKKNKTKRFNKYAYAKTDSKNQAKQIVQLNKKINKIYKNVKPEIKRFDHSDTVVLGGDVIKVIEYETMLGQTASTYFKGNYAKHIYFNFKMFINPGAADFTKARSYRIVILQTKQQATPDDSIFASSNFNIFSPFKDNITLKYKILLSKVYTISSDKEMFYRSFNFKKLLSYKKNSDGQTYGFIYVMLVAPPGQENTTIYYTSKIGLVDN